MHRQRKTIASTLFRLILAALAAGMTGCASMETVSIGQREPSHGSRGASKVPPQANVSRLTAWRDAEALSSREAGRSSAVGSGDSMAPVYGDNTLLVLATIDYRDLETGMTVAYCNERGRQVVHRLVENTASGWRVQGLNNVTEDRERVTRQNLIGVVYASLHSDGTDSAPAVD